MNTPPDTSRGTDIPVCASCPSAPRDTDIPVCDFRPSADGSAVPAVAAHPLPARLNLLIAAAQLAALIALLLGAGRAPLLALGPPLRRRLRPRDEFRLPPTPRSRARPAPPEPRPQRLRRHRPRPLFPRPLPPPPPGPPRPPRPQPHRRRGLRPLLRGRTAASGKTGPSTTSSPAASGSASP